MQGLGIQGAYEGIKFYNVDRSTIRNDRTCLNGLHGIYLRNGCDSNLIANNVSDSNGAVGIYLHAQTMYNTVRDNRADSNLNYGIYIDATTNNTFAGNAAGSNKIYGFFVATGADNNVFLRNTASMNAVNGLRLESSNSNRFEANAMYANTAWSHSIDGASGGDTCRKNNFSGSVARPDSILYNNTPARFDYPRNWWGTTDSLQIKSKIRGPGRDFIIFIPYRLGPVDTAPGADTVAPKAPDTVMAAPLTTTSIRVSWSPTIMDEEPDAYSTNLAGYKIYRSPLADTSYWSPLASVAAASLSYDDTGLQANATWFYRVTAVDSWTPYENQSFYSDSIASATTDAVDTSIANFWYVNDGSTSGDSFTSAVGNDANNGLTMATPKRTIAAVMSLLSAGDIVLVDSGLFAEAVVISTSNIAIIGKDSASTRIDPPGDSSIPGLFALHCTGVAGVRIRNVGTAGAFDGIRFTSTDQSVIENSNASGCYEAGVYLVRGSDGNVLRDLEISDGASHGVTLDSTYAPNNNNTIESSLIRTQASRGIIILKSDSNIIRWNRIVSIGNRGIDLALARGTIVAGNLIRENSTGILFGDASDRNIIAGNIIESSVIDGIHLASGTQNLVSGNEIRGCGQYDVRIGAFGGGNTFEKNNLAIPGTSYAVFNAGSASVAMARNWWGTVDSSILRSRIWGTAGMVTFTPYRLGTVDTTAGSDTVAPRAPTTVTAAALGQSGIRVTWSAVSSSEEQEAAHGLAGYHLYRSLAADTSLWVRHATVGAGTTSFDDSGLAMSDRRYYRVTSFDAHAPFPNESFYSDSIATARTDPESNTPSPFTLIQPEHGAETTSASLRFQWSPSSDSSSVMYRLQVANNASFTSLAIDSPGLAQTSAMILFTASAWQAWRVIASDSFGNQVVSETRVFAVDPQAPSNPPLRAPTNGATITTSTLDFRWDASFDTPAGNSALALSAASNQVRYNLQLSRSPGYSSFIANDTTTETHALILLAHSDSGAIYWQVAAVDRLGNRAVTASSFQRAVPADTIPPQPPLELRGVALETGGVKLSWQPSPSSDMSGGGYRIYWDSGLRTSADTILDYVAHQAAGPITYITGILATDSIYRFRIQSVDALGNSDLNTNLVEVRVLGGAPPYAQTQIITPHSGHRVTRTGGVEVVTRVLGTPAQKSGVAAVRFQYRPSGGNWTDMLVSSRQSNPTLMRWSSSSVRGRFQL